MLAHADSDETLRLLESIRLGDREAFNRLFERHRDDLRRAVQLRLDRRLQARVDPSDIVQETQMEAFRRLDDYLERRPMPFQLWLYKTAQERVFNARRTHLKTAGRSVDREQPFSDASSMLIAASFLKRSASPSRQIVRREYVRLVNEAIGELDRVDQEILFMRNVEGFSQREIAAVLELTHDAVRKRYGRALVKLQRLLASKGLSQDPT
jgi:RNA polymerase sigma-70 factor (ECF subfamily)